MFASNSSLPEETLLSPPLDVQKRRQTELLKEKMKELHLDADEDAIDRENQTQEKLEIRKPWNRRKNRTRSMRKRRKSQRVIQSQHQARRLWQGCLLQVALCSRRHSELYVDGVARNLEKGTGVSNEEVTTIGNVMNVFIHPRAQELP
jgi:hypothetical protein